MLGPSSKLTPQSIDFGHATISVSRVVRPHDHQPRSLASAAAAGSPRHVPSAVGDQVGMSNPLSSCIHCCTSSVAANKGHSLRSPRPSRAKPSQKKHSLASGILSCVGQSATFNTTKIQSVNRTAKHERQNQKNKKGKKKKKGRKKRDKE